MAAAQLRFFFTSKNGGNTFTSDTLIPSPPPLSSNATKPRTLSLPPRKHPHFLSLQLKTRRSTSISASTMAAGDRNSQEVLPPALDSTSEPPPIFDGTTRLYISYTCPFAQRVWITRNCKVAALEHNNEIRGESLDLIKYIDSHFEGPSLFPNDPAKKEFADVLISYTDSFQKAVTSSFGEDGVLLLINIEDALSKFTDSPFFLGQFSLVDIAYAPFIERYNAFLLDVKNYDLTTGRPKLATWIQEMNKIEGYNQTQHDPMVLIESYKRWFLGKV